MSTEIKIDLNNALDQIINNPLKIWSIIFVLLILLLIGIYFYNRTNKNDWDKIDIKTRDINSKWWDVILWKWITKTK